MHGFCASMLVVLLFALAGCAVKPQPFSSQDLVDRAQQDLARLYQDQEPLGEQLDLYEAMARAVKYNLDHQVKRMEEALSRGHLIQAQNDLLPQLVASAGYSGRSNDNGSVSKSLLTNSQSLEASTSQEKTLFSSEIIYVWNILDFGVGYVQAQQTADEVLISEEWRRKAVQNIVQDVRLAYWRAAVAEQLLPEMDGLLARIETALERSRQMEKLRLQEPLKTLAYQQELLETVKQLWRMRKELSMAKTELSSLINLRPGSRFRIGLTKLPPPTVLSGSVALESLEEQALVSRPELRVEAYQERIGSREVRKAILGMLPGLEISFSANYDDNTYLYNNNWLQLGSRLSWNVFALFSGPDAVKTAKIKRELAQKRHMAVAMMTMAQVHLAQQRYGLALKDYRIADALASVHLRKSSHAAAARKANAGSELEEIRNLAGTLSARMYKGLAYAELQGAMGRIFHSSGVDPVPPVAQGINVATLGQVIREHEAKMLAAWWQETSEGPVFDEVVDENQPLKEQDSASLPVETVAGATAEEGNDTVSGAADLAENSEMVVVDEEQEEAAVADPPVEPEKPSAEPVPALVEKGVDLHLGRVRPPSPSVQIQLSAPGAAKNGDNRDLNEPSAQSLSGVTYR